MELYNYIFSRFLKSVLIDAFFCKKLNYFRYTNMKVFNPTNLIHELIVIPRFYEDITNISIRHELTDKTILVTDFKNSIDNGYLTILFEFTFKDNASYEIIVNGIDNLLWRGKGFATIKTDLENYKLI